MRRNHPLDSMLLPSLVAALFTPLALVAACETEGTDTAASSTTTGAAGGGAVGGATGTAGGGLTIVTGGNGGIGGTTTGTAGSGTGLTGGDGPCVPAACASQTWQCGDCIDNDGDGHIDSYDPDCLGPCHNNEAGFSLEIPGGSSTNKCQRDCYYDDDSGPGNDGCYWDLWCDPEEPQIERDCEYDTGSPAACPETQSEECLDICLPLVPNGCDCFGCCELPAGSGEFVYIGSESVDGVPTCSLEVQTDESLCHSCIPVEDCVNDCGPCELCLGKTLEDLPDWCFPDYDGGVPDGGYPDGGYPDGGSPQCPDGAQACGLPGQDPCPSGYYCITGCCRQIPT